MKLHAIVPTLAVVVCACHSGTPKAKSDLEKVHGEWSLAIFQSDPNPKGHLTLNDDYTFKMEVPSEDKMETISGTFAISHVTLQGKDLLMIDFSSPATKTKENPTGAIMRFNYDPEHDILHDLISLIFSRPGHEKEVRDEMDRTRAESSRGK